MLKWEIDPRHKIHKLWPPSSQVELTINIYIYIIHVDVLRSLALIYRQITG